MNRHERRAQEASDRGNRHRANEKLRALMKTTYTRFDRDLQEDLSLCKVTPESIPCKKGCSHCCEMAIFITFVEAKAIVLNHPEVVHKVTGELMRQEELCRTAGLTRRVLDIFDKTTGEERQAFNDRWWNLHTPCAFVDPETKACRVYENRPLACRSHLVVDTDPAACAARPPPGEVALVQGFNPPRAYDAALLGIYQDSQTLFGGPMIGTLPIMVLAALKGAGS